MDTIQYTHDILQSPPSILYYRGIYPADNFHTVKKYGQPVLLTEDPNLEAYLSNILKQVERKYSLFSRITSAKLIMIQTCPEWLMDKKISKLVLVVLSAETRVVLERWEFDIRIIHPEIGEDGVV